MADADKHITYSLADIQRYLQGGMNAREMHDLERAALEDPFLADALEGYREADMQQASMHLTQIEKAIRQQNQKGKIVALPPTRSYFSWQIAAAVILLVCMAGATYFIFNKKTPAAVAFTPVKNNSNSIKIQDSSLARLQTILPPSADTTTIAKVEKKQKRQINSSRAKRKKNNTAEQDSSAWQAPENAIAFANGINKAAQSSNTLSEVVTTAVGYRIAGTVTDNHQRPVPNAKVELQDSTAAVTDKNGKFYIISTDTAATANITAFGYKPLNNQKLKGSKNNIVLKERPFLLSDVEVINIGTADKKVTDTTATMPEGGWQSFREYVYNKLQKKYDSTALDNVYINGDLQLEFSINDLGEPTDFKVLHAPDEQTAQEAITAIQTGPKWVNGDKNKKLRITMKYK